MTKKVILFFPKLEQQKDFHYMPISLLAVAAPLIARGIECIVIDERIEEDYMEILDRNIPDAECVLITAYTGYQVSRAYQVSKFIKDKYENVKIIWGGPHATHLPEQVVYSQYIDIVYKGYGEVAIVDLINAMINKTGLTDVSNICYKTPEGQIVHQDFSNTINDFFDMPFDLVDERKYINPATKRFIYVSSYGCPGVCTFCSTKTPRKWIPLPIEKVKRDIQKIMEKYDYKECVFFDATIFTLKERAIQIAQIMKEYNLRWIADARAAELYNLEDTMLEMIVHSGLKQITVGLETGSEKIVTLMRKGKNHLREFKIAAEKLSKYDIKLTSGVIFGCPGETIEDLKETLQYVIDIKKINPNFFISTTFFKPLPDTVLMDVVQKDGYRMPESLEEWASLGASNHYKYNEWTQNSWMNQNDIEEYKKIYDEFRENNQNLFV